MKKFTKGLCLSAAIVAAGAMMSVNATAGEMFTISEGTVPGGAVNNLNADEIQGSYNEVVQFGVGTFDVNIHMQFGDYATNGSTFGSQLGLAPAGPFDPASFYAMYGLFSGSGTYVQSGATTVFTFTSGAYELWLDPESDSQKVDPVGYQTPGVVFGAFGVTNTVDDYKLAFGDVSGGGGSLLCANNGDNCGAFGTNLTTELTDDGTLLDGQSFFSAPVPFYELAFTSGDFTGFAVAPGTTQSVDGKISVIFNKVPEPATLALFGLGLAGMAGVARRKSKQA